MMFYINYSIFENTALLWNTFESIPLQYIRKHFFFWNTLQIIQCNMCETMPRYTLESIGLEYTWKHFIRIPILMLWILRLRLRLQLRSILILILKTTTYMKTFLMNDFVFAGMKRMKRWWMFVLALDIVFSCRMCSSCARAVGIFIADLVYVKSM